MQGKKLLNEVACQKQCQIFSVPEMAEPVGTIETIWQFRKRIKRAVKRRRNYLINLFSDVAGSKKAASSEVKVKTLSNPLQPGDLVHVKSKEEIMGTLNRWNQLKGCAFMEEMWPYCETTQRVFKRVEKFLDERDYLVKKCKGIIILEGVMCQGTKDFGPCDRSCFFFWKEEWLEKKE